MSGERMIYRFADCVLDTDRRELQRAGQVVAVEPQVFDLLVLFARRPDEVVARDGLIDEVWGGRRALPGRRLDRHRTDKAKAAARHGTDQRLERAAVADRATRSRDSAVDRGI